MSCVSPLSLKTRNGLIEVGCGKCYLCTTRRVNQWVFRMIQHMKQLQYAYFVTLTYDWVSLPITSNGFMTLRPRDVVLFWKRLRKATGAKIKYYVVGEYGTKGARPHYHAVVFSDVALTVRDFERSWQCGGVHVGTVTSSSIAYVMKYIDKPFKPMHSRDDRVPHFSRCSKGIGANWLNNVHAVNRIRRGHLYVRYGSNVVGVPRYYLSKIYPNGVPVSVLAAVASYKSASATAVRKKARALGLDEVVYLAAKKEMYSSKLDLPSLRD